MFEVITNKFKADKINVDIKMINSLVKYNTQYHHPNRSTTLPANKNKKCDPPVV
jgi:hypothetical protein